MKKTCSMVLVALICIPVALFAAGTAESSTKQVPALNANPLSDVRVRQAIAYAIDMDEMIDTLLDGKGKAAASLVPEGPWRPETLNPYKYNPAKARELLAAAKWDSNRVLDVVFYYGDQLTFDMMAVWQQNLADVGIKMEFRKLEGDIGAQLGGPPEDPVNGPTSAIWDLAYVGGGPVAMQDYYGPFVTAGGGNSFSPSDLKMDALVAATKTTFNIDVQKAAMVELQEYFNEVVPAIPLYHQQLFIFQSTRLNRKNYMLGNDSWNYDWGLADWEVTPDAGGRQVLGTNGAPREFFQQPWNVAGVNFYTRALFDHLVLADADFAPLRGQLASDYKLADDGMSITFTLREGAKWHDGSPITAHDVKWGIEYSLLSPLLNSTFTTTFTAIEGAEALRNGEAESLSGVTTRGDNIVEVKFAKLEPFMMNTWTQWAPLPSKYFKGSDPAQFQQNPYWPRPIGSGAFMIDEVEMNDFTTLVPFEGYHSGRAKIDEIIIRVGD